MKLAPSILSADFSCLGKQVRDAVNGGADWIHVDVMDGHFVPNITIGPLVVRSLRPLADELGTVLDVHLMIEQPDNYLEAFADAGADILNVHVEATPHLHRTLQAIRDLGMRPAVTLNPATPLSALEEVLPEVEMVLLMTVNPGFGGQRFIPASLRKIARLRRMLNEQELHDVEIEVDGGVNVETIADVAQAGASVAVAGSAVFNQRAPVRDNILALRRAVAAGVTA